MEKRVAGYIADHSLLQKDDPVVVGVSGGPDSMTALAILHRLGYDVVCAHFDHRLREESAGDGLFVQKAAGALSVPFVSEAGDVQGYRLEHHLSIEEAARLLRYAFLFKEARRLGAQAVVTGHTADDQVETVLMHFLRGAGLRGLKGMLPRTILTSFDADIPLVRPFLETWREEIEEFLRTAGLNTLIDPSNNDPAFFRNRLRSRLLPALAEYNPRIRQVILRTARSLAADEEVLQMVVEAARDRVVWASGPAWLRMERERFRVELPGVRTRILRTAIGQLRPEIRDVNFDCLARGDAALVSEAGVGECSLVGGLKLYLEYEDAWIAGSLEALPRDDRPQMTTGDGVALQIPGRLGLEGAWALAAEIRDGVSAEELKRGDPSRAYLDPQQISGALMLRGRKPGERFAPEGMQTGSVKVSDLMIDLKIPRRYRERWPLLVLGDEIVWVVGLRLGRGFSAKSDAGRCLVLSVGRG